MDTLTSNFTVRTATDWFDHVMNKIPFVKLIYSSLKDLIGAFVGDKRKFKLVLVSINKENSLNQIGFVTQKEDLSSLGLQNMVAVYFPHSYAFSGNHFLVPKESVRPLIYFWAYRNEVHCFGWYLWL